MRSLLKFVLIAYTYTGQLNYRLHVHISKEIETKIQGKTIDNTYMYHKKLYFMHGNLKKNFDKEEERKEYLHAL